MSLLLPLSPHIQLIAKATFMYVSNLIGVLFLTLTQATLLLKILTQDISSFSWEKPLTNNILQPMFKCQQQGKVLLFCGSIPI